MDVAGVCSSVVEVAVVASGLGVEGVDCVGSVFGGVGMGVVAWCWASAVAVGVDMVGVGCGVGVLGGVVGIVLFGGVGCGVVVVGVGCGVGIVGVCWLGLIAFCICIWLFCTRSSTCAWLDMRMRSSLLLLSQHGGCIFHWPSCLMTFHIGWWGSKMILWWWIVAGL